MSIRRRTLGWLLLGVLTVAPALASTPSVPTAGVRELTLVDALRLAVTNSPDLAQYRSKIRQTDWQVQEARSGGRPQIQFDASYVQNEPPESVSLGGHTVQVIGEQNYKVGPTLRQAIATFGRLHYQVLAAQLNEQSVRNDYRRVADTLIEQVCLQYDQALEAGQNVSIAEANLATREDHLHDSRSMFGAGTVPRFEVIRNESDVDLARQQLLQSQNQCHHAVIDLLTTLGVDPAQPVALAGAETPAPPPADVQVGVTSALQHRPELATLMSAFGAARASADYARSQLSPAINLQTSWTTENTAGFQTPNQFQTILAVSIPMFDGGRSKSQRNEALEQAEQIRQQYEAARRGVLHDVATAWDDMQIAWQRLELANKTVDETVELAKVAQVRYKGGIGTNVERLDADNNVVQVRSTAAAALYDYLQAQAHWRHALGEEYPAEVLDGVGVPSQP